MENAIAAGRLEAVEGSTFMDPAYERMFKSKSVEDLIEDIIFLHHDFLRETLPVLSRQFDRVATVYGSRHPELLEGRVVFDELARELKEEVESEEDFLFPCIRRWDVSSGSEAMESLERMTERGDFNHRRVQRNLVTLRRLLNDYAVPEDVCETYKAVLHGLADVESDTRQHQYIEAQVLFPKILQKE